MVEFTAVALVGAGLVVLFAGAALSVYGVAILGAVLGGGAGFMFAPTVGGLVGMSGLVATVFAVGVGILAGVIVAYLLLSLAVAAVSFVVGAYVGVVVVAPLVGEAAVVVGGVALAVGAGAAFLGSVMTRTVMILVTAFVGATLVSRSVTLADLTAAQADLAVEPLVFDAASPLFLLLFVFGVLTQLGLFEFGYVTALVGKLPGASVFRDRGRERGGSEAGN